jgi:hypothetical protein
LTSFFAVQKGLLDIRMVYNGTISGLNDAVWVPRFWLPTVHTFLRMVGYDSFMSDLDVGKMFLNFILHVSLRPYCGVDLTPYFPEEAARAGGRLIEAWYRAGMGFKWSPYQSVQAMMVADEMIGGDQHDPTNVFRWDRVRLNLPGQSDFDPKLPWVSKVRDADGKIAADRVIFVDDARTIGNTKSECWATTRRVGSLLSYLGLQDASRKRRKVSRNPGAWAGSVVWTSEDEVTLLVSEDKWTKTKNHVAELRAMVDDNPKALPRDRLESIRGFLICVGRTYRGIAPCLNGLHLTIDGWREGRAKGGWKQTWKERR